MEEISTEGGEAAWMQGAEMERAQGSANAGGVEVVAVSSSRGSALHAWSTFALDDKRGTLDRHAQDIAEEQHVSASSRKQLAEQTKEYKRRAATSAATATSSSSTASATEVGALLKAYQREIDRLTSRAKRAESALLWIYQALDSVPDPVPELSNAQELGERMTLEAVRLKKAEADAEEYARKLETAEGLLVENARNMENVVSERVAVVEEQTADQINALSHGFELREQELLMQLSIANEQIRENARNSKGDSRADAAEHNLADDQHREAHEELRRKQTEASKALQEQVELLSKENSRLVNQLQEAAARPSNAVLVMERGRRIRELEQKLADTVPREEHERVARELARRKDASEEVRAIGRQMQAEWSKSSGGAGNGGNGMVGNRGVGSKQWLVAKVKALELAYGDMSVKVLHSDQALADARRERAQQENMMDVSPSRSPLTTAKQAHCCSHESAMEIVAAQRERFRVRVSELEDENSELLSRLEKQLAELQSSKLEQLELCELLHTLQEASSPAAPQPSSPHAGADSVPAATGPGVPVRSNDYDRVYADAKKQESFALRREQYRRLGDMNRADRLVYRAGQTFMRNSWTRLMVFSYMLVLHVFVYVALTISASVPHCPHR